MGPRAGGKSPPPVRYPTCVLTYLLDSDDRLSLTGIATDGVEALEHSERDCPDAIICDVQMPRMDGLEALPLLRRACPEGVIVMYSSDPDTAKAAHELGADAVVDKADDPASLIELLVGLASSRCAI
jgi:CheY-like chemotaxis protein